MSQIRNPRPSFAFSRIAAIVFGVFLMAITSQAETFPGVSLKISDETVPAGDVLQLKVFLTEPKPIVKGSARTQLSSGLVTGLRGGYMYDPSGNTCGVAVLDSAGILVSFTSTGGQLGASSDYPLLTLALNLRPDLRTGTTAPLNLDLGSSSFTDPSGHPYLQEVHNGKLTVTGTLSVANVVPGGGLLQTGQTLSVMGTGFESGSRLSINEVSLHSARVVNSTRIDAVLAAPAVLDSKRVRVRTSEGTATYYSYPRTTLVGRSTRALLQASEPIFANRTFWAGSLTVKQTGTTFSGLALQNASSSTAVATLKLFTKQGALIATTAVSLPSLTKSVRDVLEVFPGAQPTDTVQVTANAPIQMLGLLADQSLGVVAPVTIGLR